MCSVALVVAGCDGGSSEPDGGSSPDRDGGGTIDAGATDGGGTSGGLSAFLDRVAAAQCEAVARCALAEVLYDQAHTSETHCRTTARARLAAYEGASIAFDAAAAEACLAEAARVACEQDFYLQDGLPLACDAALRGTVADGAACASGLDCVSGLCGCMRTCEPVAGVGAACTEMPCARGSRCEGGTCVANVAPRREGEPCTAGFEPHGDCGVQLRCIEGTCRAASSLRVRTEGEPCEWSTTEPATLAEAAWCAAGLECDTSGSSQVCRRPLANGVECSSYSLCDRAAGSCQGPSTEIQCRPYANAGEECWPEGRGSACAPGLVCDSSEPECVRAGRAVGEECDRDEVCASGVCDSGARVCTVPDFRFCP
ncbi:MAG: hypothetical protein KF729_20905 [Sandaracinaceae bacterium]|nr:hypothetical protein [Sandaracinaceae bacterium]